jgi:hypothetical protein
MYIVCKNKNKEIVDGDNAIVTPLLKQRIVDRNKRVVNQSSGNMKVTQ